MAHTEWSKDFFLTFLRSEIRKIVNEVCAEILDGNN